MNSSLKPTHTAVAERLRHWLALANLTLPTTTSEVAPEPDAIMSVFQRAKRERLLLAHFAGWPGQSPENRAKEFHEIFYAVRSILNQLLARKERPEDYRSRYLKALSGGAITRTDDGPLAPVGIARFGGGPLTEEIHIVAGCLEFHSSLLLEGFRNAFKGVELARLYRCPVCTAFYYAVRKNKGACDQHLVLARTWEFRKKTQKYRENWRINKLVKSGFPLSKARAAIVSRRTAGDSTMRGN